MVPLVSEGCFLLQSAEDLPHLLASHVTTATQEIYQEGLSVELCGVACGAVAQLRLPHAPVAVALGSGGDAAVRGASH